MKYYLVTAFIEGNNTFMSGKNIVFQVEVDVKSGDTANSVAELFLDSILSKDTKREIVSVALIDND